MANLSTLEHPKTLGNRHLCFSTLAGTLRSCQQSVPRPLPLLYLDHLLARSPKGSSGRDHLLKCADNAAIAGLRSYALGAQLLPAVLN